MSGSGTFKLVGNLRATFINVETGERREWSTSNTVTSGGLSLLRDYLLASDPSLAPIPPSFIAVGSGGMGGPAILPGRFMVTVPGEHFRSAIVQRDAVGQSVVYHSYLDPADAQNQSVSFYGLYAGNASDQLGTGTLLALAQEPVPFGKDNTNSVSLDWTLTVSGKL